MARPGESRARLRLYHARYFLNEAVATERVDHEAHITHLEAAIVFARSVEDFLRSDYIEQGKEERFAAWYPTSKARVNHDGFMDAFVDVRDMIEKRGPAGGTLLVVGRGTIRMEGRELLVTVRYAKPWYKRGFRWLVMTPLQEMQAAVRRWWTAYLRRREEQRRRLAEERARREAEAASGYYLHHTKWPGGYRATAAIAEYLTRMERLIAAAEHDLR